MKVITLQPTEFVSACHRLQDKVTVGGIVPDAVIGIRSGGEFVANNMFSGVFHAYVECRRPSSAKKSGRVGRMLKYLPITVCNLLRRVEAWRLRRKQPEMRNISTEGLPELPQQKGVILIVDDAVDSGVTIRSVKEAFQARYPAANVVTAALVVTTPNPIVEIDYTLFPQSKYLIRFPWSKDYR